tara:strand:+ start:94 stop:309 length:216 start_codon:yes stop_codon:yes gene_type:complete
MLIKKYKKELRKERAVRKCAKDWAKYPERRNEYMIAHGKTKILNMIIKDLSNLEQPPKRLSVITRLKHWFS